VWSGKLLGLGPPGRGFAPPALDTGVAPGEYQPFMTVIRPPDEERRLSVLAVNLQDLGVLVVFANTVAPYDQSVPWFGVHLHLRLLDSSIRAWQHTVIEAMDLTYEIGGVSLRARVRTSSSKDLRH
jgi:hypothetical protein